MYTLCAKLVRPCDMQHVPTAEAEYFFAQYTIKCMKLAGAQLKMNTVKMTITFYKQYTALVRWLNQ